MVDFGTVINLLHLNPDFLAYRKGWQGKKQFIYVERGKRLDNLREPLKSHVKTIYNQDHIDVFSHFNFIVDGGLVSGWLASQTDMLATDWIVLNVEGGTVTE